MAGRLGRAVYNTPRWARLRRAKLAAVNWRCEKCGAWTREVHHVVPLEDGGPPYPPLDGLRALCRECHQRAHGKGADPAERREWRALFSAALHSDGRRVL